MEAEEAVGVVVEGSEGVEKSRSRNSLQVNKTVLKKTLLKKRCNSGDVCNRFSTTMFQMLYFSEYSKEQIKNSEYPMIRGFAFLLRLRMLMFLKTESFKWKL